MYSGALEENKFYTPGIFCSLNGELLCEIIWLYLLLVAAGDDYDFPALPLTFATSTPAEGRCFLPGIINDTFVENMEEYTLQLSSSELNVDASRRDATINIDDDDG